LFRTFLKGEFSDENVDFWLECEEFKKMKEGKKTTVQRAHAIFNEYIVEQSPKEVQFLTNSNLEVLEFRSWNVLKFDTKHLIVTRIVTSGESRQ
uniref:Regulator of G-protein signaling rgs-7 (inferred by orthology to a C. elegans protein) n=1 Tax=Anisakis simplex TaxID=6269 RepID=A0A0M3JB17_ANISI